MISRREFAQLVAATAALLPVGWSRALAQQLLTQAELLRFEPLGNVTLVHIADIHAQLLPVLFREPSANLGVGEAKGVVPRVTGRALLDLYKFRWGRRVSFTTDINKWIGDGISDLKLLRTGKALEQGRDYVVSGWASVNEGTEGPSVWDVVIDHVRKKGVVVPRDANHVRVVGG